jgi:hypothetical protein
MNVSAQCERDLWFKSGELNQRYSGLHAILSNPFICNQPGDKELDVSRSQGRAVANG